MFSNQIYMYRSSGNSPKVLNAKKNKQKNPQKNHTKKKQKKTKKTHKNKKTKKNSVARIKVILIALLSGKCNNAWEFCTLSL